MARVKSAALAAALLTSISLAACGSSSSDSQNPADAEQEIRAQDAKEKQAFTSGDAKAAKYLCSTYTSNGAAQFSKTMEPVLSEMGLGAEAASCEQVVASMTALIAFSQGKADSAQVCSSGFWVSLGAAPCKQLIAKRTSSFKALGKDLIKSVQANQIDSIKVDGDKATMVSRSPGSGTETAHLIRVDGVWKTDSVDMPGAGAGSTS